MGNISINTVTINGRIIPVPNAWTIRPNSKKENAGAIAAITTPIRDNMIPDIINFLC